MEWRRAMLRQRKSSQQPMKKAAQIIADAKAEAEEIKLSAQKSAKGLEKYLASLSKLTPRPWSWYSMEVPII